MNQLSWTTIVGALILASSTAYLVIFRGWDYMTTVFFTSGIMFALALFVFVFLLLVMPKNSRGEFLIIIYRTMCQDFKLFQNLFEVSKVKLLMILSATLLIAIALLLLLKL
jgi:hypothetical protein